MSRWRGELRPGRAASTSKASACTYCSCTIPARTPSTEGPEMSMRTTVFAVLVVLLAGPAPASGAGGPFEPVEGLRFAAIPTADGRAEGQYLRLTKVVDLTAASSAQLRFMLSADTEPGFDHLLVEAHTLGQEDWDDTRGSQRRELHGAARGKPRLPGRWPGGSATSVPRALLQRNELRRAGDQRRLELLHRIDRWLARRGVRPVLVCRRPRRAVDRARVG